MPKMLTDDMQDVRAEPLTPEHPRPRRSVLGWGGRIGVGITAVMTELLFSPTRSVVTLGAVPLGKGGAQDASASHGCWPHTGLYGFGCCALACPPQSCPGAGPSHTCNSGSKKSWTCCDAAQRRVRVCSECTTGPNCFYEVFSCSESWLENFDC